MKTLYCLLIILLCSPPLHAEQALVLTEIEKIQESIWYLQKDLAAQDSALKKYQDQVGTMTATSEESRRQLSERIDVVQGLVENQRTEARQVNQKMEELKRTLTSLASGDDTQQGIVLEQAQRIKALEKSLQELRGHLSEEQEKTGAALTEAQQQLEETRQQLEDTRSQVSTLGQEIGGRVEKIGLLGAGALLILAIGLTIGLALRKRNPTRSSSDLKHPPKHEM